MSMRLPAEIRNIFAGTLQDVHPCVSARFRIHYHHCLPPNPCEQNTRCQCACLNWFSRNMVKHQPILHTTSTFLKGNARQIHQIRTTNTDENINTLVIVFLAPSLCSLHLFSFEDSRLRLCDILFLGWFSSLPLDLFCKWRCTCGRRSISRFSFLKYCALFKRHGIRGMCLRTSGKGHHPHVTSVGHSQTHHAHAKSSWQAIFRRPRRTLRWDSSGCPPFPADQSGMGVNGQHRRVTTSGQHECDASGGRPDSHTLKGSAQLADDFLV